MSVKIKLTSGQVLDIISSLCEKGNQAFDSQEYQLSDYYFKMAYQFEKLYEEFENMIPEEREVDLVIAGN